MINHVAIKTIGQNLLFTNKPAKINDWLPPCHNAAGHGPRGVKTDCAVLFLSKYRGNYASPKSSNGFIGFPSLFPLKWHIIYWNRWNTAADMDEYLLLTRQQSLLQYPVQGSCCTGLMQCINWFANVSRPTCILAVESLGVLIKVKHL